jgi:DNA repair exonuclease SbcCD nuclease subunit
MFTFLHAADIHLDSPLKGLDRYDGAPVDEFRGATRKALENLVRLAVDERVAFVLIAGDLYDGDWPDYNTGLFFGRQMARLHEAGIPVVLIRGNHDAQNKMTRDLRLPDSTRFLSTDRPETHILTDCDVAVHGQGFASQAVTENLARAYPAARTGCFNIGMLHTSLTGREPHEPYAPCDLADLRTLGYGYWALGHVHTPEVLVQADPVIAFPGNVQGRHAREAGARGCLLVTVDDSGAATVAPRPLDVVRWDVCRVDAAGATDPDAVLDLVRDRLAARLAAADDRTLAVRVELSGPCRVHDALVADPDRWTAEFRQVANALQGGGRVWVEKVVFRTRAEAALDAWLDGPLAELSALLAELRADPASLRALLDRELADLSRKAGRDFLEDLDPSTLVEQVAPLLLSRLAAG